MTTATDTQSALMGNYGHPQFGFSHGKGSYLYTENSERYLDFGTGIAVNSLGHCHPALVRALQQQAEKLWHCSNMYRIEATEQLARRLVELTFADRVFFANSGTEAVECGFKIMRRYHYANDNPLRYRIIALSESFHGRTLAPVAASANPAHIEGFLSGDHGYDQVLYGDLEALKAAISNQTAGIVMEPIQGEGGIRTAGRDYLNAVRELCDQHGILLMYDEVQSGVGRSGELYAYQALGVQPDLMASAKGLGGGFPIGACLATEAVARVMVTGTHGSTFGGNPLATSVAMAVLDEICADGFLEQVKERSAQLQVGLTELIKRHPDVLADQTGMGLMIGIKCRVSNTDLLTALNERRMLAVKAGANSVRLLPPLNVTAEQIDEALSILESACAALDH